MECSICHEEKRVFKSFGVWICDECFNSELYQGEFSLTDLDMETDQFI